MNPGDVLATIPAADAVPMAAPAALFHALLLLTSVLHLLAMNLLVGGVMLSLIARLRARRSSEAHLQIALTIEKLLPVAVAATVTLGVAPLLFLQVLYGRLFFVSSILLGWWWLAIVPVLIAVYYGTYALASRRGGLAAVAGIALALLAVGAMLSLNMSLMLWPGQFAARYFGDPAGLRPDAIDGSNPVRWLHFMVAAVAVSGVVLAAWGWRVRATTPEISAPALRLGLVSFSAASAVNALVGLSWFGLLPGVAIGAMTGDSGLATLSLAVAAILGLITAWVAFVLATKPSERVGGSDLARAGTILLLTVVAMVLLRDRLRAVMLAPTGYSLPAAAPQWGVIALFAACLTAAVGLIAWMVHAYLVSVPGIRHGKGQPASRESSGVIRA